MHYLRPYLCFRYIEDVQRVEFIEQSNYIFELFHVNFNRLENFISTDELTGYLCQLACQIWAFFH